MLAISGVLNVTMGLILVVLFHLDVSGVAAATVIANIVSSMILLYRLTHMDAVIRVDLHELGVDLLTLRQILRIGLPAGVQSAVFAVANIIIQAAINSLGTVVMATSSVAFNIEIIACYVLNSFGQACATFTGQNYGARQIRRCRRVLGVCILEDFIATAATIAVVLFFGRGLLALLTPLLKSSRSATPDSSWCSPPTRSACCTKSCPVTCAVSASPWCRRCSPWSACASPGLDACFLCTVPSKRS